MVYGHGHLIDHLKTLPRQAKFNFLRYLRQIDIETMDLVFCFITLAVPELHPEENGLQQIKTSTVIWQGELYWQKTGES